MKKVIVVGAGFAGLSAACLLAKNGFEVEVHEKLDQPGGRARLWSKDGFHFDMGPSWYMMPEVFENFFHQFGKSAKDYYQLERLDPQYKIFFEEKNVEISADLEQNLALFESIEPGAAKKFQAYLDHAKYLYDTSMQKFIYRDYQSMKDFADPVFLKQGLPKGMFQNLDRFISRYFKNEQLKKILEYTVVFLGGNPKNTPGMYSLMSHVDFNLGVWYPRGGLNAVAVAMYKLAKSLGVTFAFSSDVKAIHTINGKAVSVEANDRVLDAHMVLVSGDYAHAELHLLNDADRTYSQRYWQSRTLAPSAFILYLGVKKRLPNLRHHNLILANHWQKHFEEIFSRPNWPDTPSYYVCCPTQTEQEMAPQGMENLFILVPVASGLEDDDTTRLMYRDKIIRHLEQMIGEPFGKDIIVERVFSQKDFLADYHSYKGTALGLAHTLLQTAAFRPRHRSKKIENLFYTGQYTHPGIGVPMVIIASKITAELMTEYGNQT